MIPIFSKKLPVVKCINVALVVAAIILFPVFCWFSVRYEYTEVVHVWWHVRGVFAGIIAVLFLLFITLSRRIYDIIFCIVFTAINSYLLLLICALYAYWRTGYSGESWWPLWM